MRLRALGLLVVFVAPGLSAQTTDTVLVTLADGEARVRQRLTPEGEDIHAFAMRFEGQDLVITEVFREGESLLDASLVPAERAYRLDVVSGAPITVEYTLSGDVTRIPLFVSGGRAELTVVRDIEAPFLVRLAGEPATLSAVDLPTSLPRFEIAADGSLEVALSSLPALVRLSGGGAFSFTRVADMVVLALILAGAIWTWRNARVRRAAGPDQS